ncbi:hypothetical protein CQW23_26862 [Capsicum baccatum]|uniref:Uncharacterized protein n=1 Tax=Capsicum baccatum TaxID=33114 RepID=A0A2G2VQ24_CAPBA|nr:hypothetical protein CQW23_26862 [Capsicum baccatum]
MLLAKDSTKTAFTVDLQDTLRRFTFDFVCQIGFGFNPKYLLPSLPPTPFADTYRTAAKLSILRYTTLPLIWSLRKDSRTWLMNFTTSWVILLRKKKERLLAREDLEDKDVLAKILRRAKGEQLDDTFLIHTAVNFIMGGHDAMCPALTWFFGLVSSNPNVEKVIVREIREKDGRLSDMVYMHASIYESLRLFPPFPADSKEAVEDDVWPDGTKVKKGTSIFYHIFAMGRSPELWGPDWPDFSSERWLERRSGSSDEWNFIARDPFMYPVFHAGPRTCLGKEIAVVIVKMITLPIAVRLNSSYEDLVASVMESKDLDCEPSNVVISYLMNSRKSVHLTIIKNGKHVSLYMMDVGVDGFRPILIINVVESPFEEPLNSSPPLPRCPSVDDDLNKYENDGDYPINMEDNYMDMEYDSLDSGGVEEYCGSGSQPSHFFSDRTNFYRERTFSNKKELKMLLDQASRRQSFNFVTERVVANS